MDYNFDSVCNFIRVGTQTIEAAHYTTRKDVSTSTKVWITALAVSDLALCFKEFRHHHPTLEWVVFAGRILVVSSSFSGRQEAGATRLAQFTILTKSILKYTVKHFDIRKVAEPRILDALTGAQIFMHLLFFGAETNNHYLRREEAEQF